MFKLSKFILCVKQGIPVTSLTGIPNDLEKTCVLFFKRTEREILKAEYVFEIHT